MAAGTTSGTVTTSDTEIVAENAGRAELSIINDSDTDIYLSPVPIGGAAAAVVGSGYFLKAEGGVFNVTRKNVNARLFVGSVRAIHDGTGSKNVAIVELDQR